MKRGGELAYLFLSVALVGAFLALMLHFDVAERVSYQITLGKMRAARDTLPSEDQLDEISRTTRTVAELVAPAVVSITTESYRKSVGGGEIPPRDIFDLDEQDSVDLDEQDGIDLNGQGSAAEQFDSEDGERTAVTRGLGSGFVFDADQGYVLTASHVVEGARVVRVFLADGRMAMGEVLGADPESDLAVLRIDIDGLYELPMGDSSLMDAGDDVLAVGNPFGLNGTFSKGIVSAPHRRDVIARDMDYQGLIQTDAVINPGNSGGPLINMRAEVIGVNTAIATSSGSYEGVGFAVPSNRIKGLVDDLIGGGPAFLGVIVGNVTDFRRQSLVSNWHENYGAWVDEVAPGLAADRSGVVSGDIIVSISGQQIDTIRSLGDIVSRHEPGDTVAIQLWRVDAFKTIQVELSRRYAPHWNATHSDDQP